MRRALTARRLIIAPIAKSTELLAQVLYEYARWHCDNPCSPETMRTLATHARLEAASAAWAWATLFHAEAQERRGRHDEALPLARSVLAAARTPNTALPKACAAAAAGRILARLQRPAEGLAILQRERREVPAPFALAQILHAEGLVRGVQGTNHEVMQCLEHAATVALSIPNPLIAGGVWHDIAMLRDGHGDVDGASAARIRAAVLYWQAGRVQRTVALLEQALRLLETKSGAAAGVFPELRTMAGAASTSFAAARAAGLPLLRAYVP